MSRNGTPLFNDVVEPLGYMYKWWLEDFWSSLANNPIRFVEHCQNIGITYVVEAKQGWAMGEYAEALEYVVATTNQPLERWTYLCVPKGNSSNPKDKRVYFCFTTEQEAMVFRLRVD